MEASKNILETVNELLKVKITSLKPTKIKPNNLSFGLSCSKGFAIWFSKTATYVEVDGLGMLKGR